MNWLRSIRLSLAQLINEAATCGWAVDSRLPTNQAMHWGRGVEEVHGLLLWAIVVHVHKQETQHNFQAWCPSPHIPTERTAAIQEGAINNAASLPGQSGPRRPVNHFNAAGRPLPLILHQSHLLNIHSVLFPLFAPLFLSLPLIWFNFLPQSALGLLTWRETLSWPACPHMARGWEEKRKPSLFMPPLFFFFNWLDGIVDYFL